MRYLSLAVATLFLSSCYQQPIYKHRASNNKDYKVEYLFEHEGCKVYRFEDGGLTVYFTNCKGNGETIAYGDSTVTKNSINHPK